MKLYKFKLECYKRKRGLAREYIETLFKNNNNLYKIYYDHIILIINERLIDIFDRIPNNFAP